MRKDKTMRFITIFILFFTASSLSACGGTDDLDITLPFVGNIMAKSKAKEGKMASRGSLVLPPSAVQGLPTPISAEQAAASQNWPMDPDQNAKNKATITALKEQKYRKDGDWKGERQTGNGLEEFNNKIDWSKRQKGCLAKRSTKAGLESSKKQLDNP